MRAGTEERPILEVDELVMAFGGLTALMNISFKVERGTITAVIGPNGAGKTTLFNVINGVLAPTEGRIVFDGRPIAALKPHQIATLGVARTFQMVELFDNMTVLENIMSGRYPHIVSSFWACGLKLPFMRRQERNLEQHAMGILDFIGLAAKSRDPAGTLPLGERKMLEIGRALASDPQMVCLDEPAAGLNESETRAAARLIEGIRNKGVTVLLVEHDMQMIMDISDEIMVLNYGEKIAEGRPAEIRRNPAVIEAYLGEGEFC